jgi:hypothetical protein
MGGILSSSVQSFPIADLFDRARRCDGVALFHERLARSERLRQEAASSGPLRW